MSSESPQKSSDRKPERRRKCDASHNRPHSLSVGRQYEEQPSSEQVQTDSVKSPLPIRLPTKCKPKTDSDSDSDSKSTKSSASSSSKVSKVFKKTFKGKAIAIVKPFSNAVTEKKSPVNEKQKEIEERLNLYEFGSDEDRENSQRKKIEQVNDKNLNKESVEDPSDVSISKSSSAISSLKGIKRLKSGKHKQGSQSARRLKSSPELKSVRVRVEKLRNSSVKSDRNKVRQQTEQETLQSPAQSQLNQLETGSSSEKDSPSSCSQSEAASSSAQDSSNQKSSEKVLSESETGGAGRPDEGGVEDCEVKRESPSPQSQSAQPEPSGEPGELQSKPGQHLVKLNDDKIIEIVKSELFSEPLPIKTETVKVEKCETDRDEDRKR